MKCPFCGCVDTKVLDSRPNEDRSAIRRRRECTRCEKRFTTYEKIETIPLIVIKKDNNREAYDRTKIEKGVLRACYKRPVSAARLEQLIDNIENDVYSLGSAEVKSTQIGEIVMDRLKEVDQVAYVRFASVYRQFTDLNSFIKTIEQLKQR